MVDHKSRVCQQRTEIEKQYVSYLKKLASWWVETTYGRKILLVFHRVIYRLNSLKQVSHAWFSCIYLLGYCPNEITYFSYI